MISLMKDSSNNYCVILAGGTGSRLWPYSRKQMPKQFLDFLGSGRTLLQLTYDRFAKIVPSENIYISTNVRYRDIVKSQLPDIGNKNILVEPTWRNTAPSMAWASHYISCIDAKANIVVAPSDQLILNEENFRTSVLGGLDFVNRTKNILALGIRPTRPETAYGYVQMHDEPLENDIYKVKSFTEKPQREFAEMFVQSGEFLWNTGLFLWNVETVLKSFENMSPTLAEKLGKLHGGMTPEEEARQVKDNYSSCPNISLDRGILETSDNIYVQMCNFGWVDFGTWQALYGAAEKDENGNVLLDTKARLYNCKNNIVHMGKGKLAVLQDLEGYVVVDEGNVLMVCKGGDAATVRKMVNDVQLDFGEDFL
jgi:mannose-1-phosphate guanylyltransferase